MEYEYPKLQRERLEITINVLEDVIAKKKKFDMIDWMDNPFLDNIDLNLVESQLTDDECFACGTSACAFGYAALDPRLQALGLSMELELENDNESRVVKVTTIEEYNDAIIKFVHQTAQEDPSMYVDMSACPRFNGSCDFAAAQEFYGISAYVAEYLFFPRTYPNTKSISPQEVIDRIREVLDNNGVVE